MKLYHCFAILICCLFLQSCGKNEKSRFVDLVQEWLGKSIRFPSYSLLALQGNDTVNMKISGKYKMLTYVDTVGCISCYLQLERWKTFMEMDEMDSVQFLFFFPPKKQHDVLEILKTSDFSYPICLDEHNSLNNLNHFPIEFGGQTFLLDKENRVLAIGNPIHNRKVKELYLKIIQGKPLRDDSKDKQVVTTVTLEATALSMGDFAWQEERQGTFRLKNTGEKPLVIQDVITSCGCLTVDYPQEPVMPGKEAVIGVTYKADSPGYFNKVMMVYCNAENSPIKLRVSGNAQ